MAQTFKETAHLKTDLKKYEENWESIFGKKERTVSNNENSVSESSPSQSLGLGAIIDGAPHPEQQDIDYSWGYTKDEVDQQLGTEVGAKEVDLRNHDTDEKNAEIDYAWGYTKDEIQQLVIDGQNTVEKTIEPLDKLFAHYGIDANWIRNEYETYSGEDKADVNWTTERSGWSFIIGKVLLKVSEKEKAL